MEVEELLRKVEEKIDTDKIRQTLTDITEMTTKERNKAIHELQTMNNTFYEKEGFNDETLELQIIINKLRNKYDIPDPDETLDNGYVQ